MKRLFGATALVAALWAAPAMAYCGADHKGWDIAARELFFRLVSIEQQMSDVEHSQMRRDVALLESVTVGEAQFKALERLVLVGQKYRHRGIIAAAYELEGLAYHTVSEHNGSLAQAASFEKKL